MALASLWTDETETSCGTFNRKNALAWKKGGVSLVMGVTTSSWNGATSTFEILFGAWKRHSATCLLSARQHKHNRQDAVSRGGGLHEATDRVFRNETTERCTPSAPSSSSTFSWGYSSRGWDGGRGDAKRCHTGLELHHLNVVAGSGCILDGGASDRIFVASRHQHVPRDEATPKALECDDVIRRAHVSGKREPPATAPRGH